MNPRKGWLPEGTTQGDLDDGDFAWLSDAYKKGDESKSAGRKLPYQIHGTVNEAGWEAAWSRAHSMADGDFDGGPARTAVEAKLTRDKPDGVDIEGDGKHAVGGMEYKTFSFKAGDTTGLGEDEFCGYLSTFNGIDDGGDSIAPGAFTGTIADFLTDGVVCWQHDLSNPIGKWLEVREDAHGLWVKGRISQTTAGKDALILLRDQVVKKMSIGYRVLGYKVLCDEEGASMFGQAAYEAALRTLPWYQDGIRVLTAIKLYEGSLVTLPMNSEADVTGVKEFGPRAGLTLDAHLAAVHAAVAEYVARVKSLAELRRKAGRMLSAANIEKLSALRDAMHESMGAHVQTIDDLLAANNPDDDGDGDADGDSPDGKAARSVIHRELLRFERMQASLNGVQ